MSLGRGVRIDVAVARGPGDLLECAVEPHLLPVEEGDVAGRDAQRAPAPAARGRQQIRVADDVDPGVRRALPDLRQRARRPVTAWIRCPIWSVPPAV